MTSPTAAVLVPLSKMLHLYWPVPTVAAQQLVCCHNRATTEKPLQTPPAPVHSMWLVPTALYQDIKHTLTRTLTEDGIFRPACWVCWVSVKRSYKSGPEKRSSE